MDQIKRHIKDHLCEALADRPVVLLNGARQTGKSTLVQGICKQRGMPYFTMDDFTLLAAARNDPAGFLSGIKGPVAIDEVQRAPELFMAIKAEVDRERTPGRFLLTGSANVMMLPGLSQYLVGRMEILTLRPFSMGEMFGQKEQFISRLFSDDKPENIETNAGRDEILNAIISGGYPEAIKMRSERRRIAWFNSYITTLLQRDVRDLSQIEGLNEIPRLLSLLASQTCSLLNLSEISRNLSLSATTMKRYVSLLQAVFIIRLFPAWSGNVGKRLIKSPKVFLNDTGLLSFLTGINKDQVLKNPDKAGALVENFVMQELEKQMVWLDFPVNLFYYRTAGGREVDFIMETLDGRILGIEVKSAASVHSRDFKGLYDLSETVGNRFHRGVVLYFGQRTVPFGDKLFAMPVSSLWDIHDK